MSVSFYLSYVVFILIADCFFSLPFTIQSIINPSVFHFSTKMGWITILGELFGGIISSLIFVFLEGKFKKALDFISTTFIIHLIIITLLCEFPKNFCWWISTISSFLISTFTAGKISMNYEMQAINLDSIFPSALRN
ncbi:Integral membrane protein of the Golgi [Tritrichomonas musculus]|uniref:Integral membrane protein of the Golgi n=1 Tax=Tritrichomonas musculus TaxID=1915356 RepID=A0ABR2ID09_9EUKA